MLLARCWDGDGDADGISMVLFEILVGRGKGVLSGMVRGMWGCSGNVVGTWWVCGGYNVLRVENGEQGVWFDRGLIIWCVEKGRERRVL